MNTAMRNVFIYILLIAVSVVLYFVSRSNYLLFHAVTEIYSIIIAAGIYFVSWNSRTHSQNQNLVFLGIAYLFVGIIDFFHVLSYQGMNIFIDYSFYANQLWICARLMESISLLIFVLLSFRKIKISFSITFAAYLTAASLFLLSVFVWKIFPVCFIAGAGQTRFKIISEFIINFILILSLITIFITRARYDRKLFVQITWSIVFTIISEFCFTVYMDNYGIMNVIGHLFKVFSFYLIYQSIIVNTLKRPFDIIYSELKETQAILQAAMDQSSAGIAISEAPGDKLRYVNNAGLDILGSKMQTKPGGSIMDRSFAELVILDSDGTPVKHDEARLSRAIINGEINSREFIIRKTDETDRIVLANTAPIRNTSGDITAGIMVFQDITGRKLAEKKILNLLNEKKLILKEVHHRIKNNMNTIYSLLILQADSIKDSVSKNILSEAASRVDSMGVLYDRLYRSENESALSLNEYFTALIDDITGIYSYKSPVKIQTHIADIILSAKILSSLGIIINELITNSIKYAFAGGTDGIISVSAEQAGKLVTIVYKDNGTGIPDSVTFEKTSGFGMQLISMLVEQINGSISLKRDQGTIFTIEFEV